MTEPDTGPHEDPDEWADSGPDRWADSGPEPNEPAGGSPADPLRGVVPAGAMSDASDSVAGGSTTGDTEESEDSPESAESEPAEPAEPAEATTSRDAAMAASDARRTEIVERTIAARKQIAALEAEIMECCVQMREETGISAHLWVPAGRKGFDEGRTADTEAAQEIAVALNVPQNTAANRISEAMMLDRDLPATFEALKKGDISYRHVQRITSHATSLPVDSRGPFEDLVVPIATVKTVNQVEPKLKDIRERMHPESITERHTRAVEDRSVWLTGRPDGMVELTALLTAEVGVSAFGRIATAADVLGTKEETRTKPQRMADVFADLLLDSTTAATRGVFPTVLVTVPIRTAAGLGDEPGNLNGYGIVSPDTARELFAKAPSFRRVLVDEDTGEVLNLGRTRYRPAAGQRLAVALAHPTCAGIGCTKRAELSEIDHTDPYNEGNATGLTDLPNLHPLCAKDHTDKHNTRIKVASIEGNLVWTLPSGQMVVTEPEMLVHDKPVTLKVTRVPEELEGIDLFAHTDVDEDGEPDSEEWDPNEPTPF